MINRCIFWVFGSVLLSSCWKTEPTDNDSDTFPGNSTKIAVLCEGNFLWNNAQLDVYFPDSNQLWSNAFEAVNKQPVGDVLQSGAIIGNDLYLVVNNSGMLLKLDPKTLQLKQRIAISKSPRYLAQWGGSLYVTDLESNAVTKFDTLTNSIEKFAVLPNGTGSRAGWTEQIVPWQNRLIAAVYDGYLWVHDPAAETSRLIKSDTGTQYVGVDSRDKLWVLASHNGKTSLTQLDESFNIVQKIAFPANHSVSRMAFSASKDTMWFLVNGALQGRSVSNPNQSWNKIIPYTTPYGLGVNPYNGDIYVSDAYDYIRKGRVVRLNSSGDSVLNDFFSGIIPASFVFLPK